ncbi:hypothetical protein ACH4MU_20555 [Streptomyces albidoflavus]
MAIAELVLKYLDTLVWPVVTVVLVWMVRAQIRQAFGRLTRLETPAGTLEFEAEARAVRDEADALRASGEDSAQGGHWPGRLEDEPPPDEEDGPPDPAEEPEPDERSRGGGWGGASGDSGGGDVATPPVVPASLLWPDFREAMDLAERAPASAVRDAWVRVRQCGMAVWRANGRTKLGTSPHARLVESWLWLIEAGLSTEAQQLYSRLSDLSDEAGRDPHRVTPAAARDFVRSCRVLAAEMREFL